MNNTKILNLFKAYTAKELNQEQFDLLKKWINQSPENKQQFSNYLLFYKRSRRIAFFDALDQNKAWDKVVSQLEQPLILPVKEKRKSRKLYYRYAAAASVLIIVALTIFLNREDGAPQFVEPIIVNNQIEPGIEKATLTLEDGSDITLEKGAQYQNSYANSNGEAITYNNSTSHELVYNYLTIPRGGQFQITLSDGTKVWLNSESQLKYPISFTDGESRQVELVYGEAYFEVSPSTEHNGSDFKVYNNNQEIQVLGTKFNIKAYKDETNIYTTLVEGKVSVSTVVGKQILLPNQQSNLNLITNTIKVSTVDVYKDISWKEGVFSFENMSLKDIMKVLTRWYDMDVIFENKELQNETFNGGLKKNQDIVTILDIISNMNNINYEINNKTITLK